MKVGVVLPTADVDGEEGASWAEIRRLACLAESVGLDSVWVADHLIIREAGRPDEGIREAWTTLAALAEVTSAVLIGTLVSPTPFRAPAVLAKMAQNLDEIANGRLILGLGCGWHLPEFRTFGLPADHLVSRFEEAIPLVRALLRGERVTHLGSRYQLDDAVLLPPPWRPSPGIPLLVAGASRRMLGVAARHADAWNTNGYGRPDALFLARRGGLRQACDDVPRDPATIEVTAGVQIAMSGSSRAAEGALRPDASAIAAALAEWESLGVGHVQLSPLPASMRAIDLVGDALRQVRDDR